MQRIPVGSSNLRSVGYDAEHQLLEIEFNDGSVYRYFNVPLSAYQGLLGAGSKGGYHRAFIRDRYAFQRIL